jgi:hypothetical protein
MNKNKNLHSKNKALHTQAVFVHIGERFLHLEKEGNIHGGTNVLEDLQKNDTSMSLKYMF